MSDSKIKFKRIFLPHLLVITGFIIGYTLLHWLVIARFEAFEPTERISVIAIPVILCWLPVLLIWRLPGIHLLKSEAKEGNPLLPYFIIVLACLLIPTICAQYYLIAAAGKLNILSNINQVTNKPLTKYYKLPHIYVDRNHNSFQCNTYMITDKQHNRAASKINIDVYIVCPVYADSTKANYDTAAYFNKPDCWFGQGYDEVIAANQDQEINNERIQEFIKESIARFRRDDQPKFEYMERVYNSGPYQAYLAAANKKLEIPLTNAIVFEGRESLYRQRFNMSLLMTIVSYIITNISLFGLISSTQLGDQEITDLKD